MSEWMPELVTHAYWEKKENFLYETDTYLTWVLFAIEEGRFEYQIGKEFGEAGYGDLVVCPPHVAFYRTTLSTLSFHAITFNFTDEDHQSLASFLPDRKISLPQTQRLSENYSQLRAADQRMHDNGNNQRLKQHFFLDLWLMMIHRNRHQMDADPLLNEDELIRDVAIYLKSHAHEPLEIRNVAQLYGLTPVNLIRRFRNMYQVNPLQYLTSLRVKKACRLLLATNEKLDEIAAQCGYENGFYLSRVFSKLMGMSPSVYRKQNRF